MRFISLVYMYHALYISFKNAEQKLILQRPYITLGMYRRACVMCVLNMFLLDIMPCIIILNAQ